MLTLKQYRKALDDARSLCGPFNMTPNAAFAAAAILAGVRPCNLGFDLRSGCDELRAAGITPTPLGLHRAVKTARLARAVDEAMFRVALWDDDEGEGGL